MDIYQSTYVSMWWLRHKVYLLQIIQKGLETQKTERENTSSSLFVVEKLIKPSPISLSLSHIFSVFPVSVLTSLEFLLVSLCCDDRKSISAWWPSRNSLQTSRQQQEWLKLKAAFTPYKLTTFTVFKFSSSVHTWVLCVAPGRPCPPHPAAWTR